MKQFYVGLHKPWHAAHFDAACISVNVLRPRKSPFTAGRWIMDSGAFTEISTHGRYRSTVADYAAEARRWTGIGTLEAIVAQDYMCEPFILRRTGLTVADHQRLTIERFDDLAAVGLPVPILPVLQGFAPAEYADHVCAYGDRLEPGAWCGVGSVCKRNAAPEQVLAVLVAIHAERPDLRLHGFGIKLTSLRHPGIRAELYSADSMAWSFNARKNGRNRNSWQEAAAFVTRVAEATERPPTAWQTVLPF